METITETLDSLLPPKGSKPVPILKLRTTHHELARLLSLGFKDVDISRMTGYSQSRICILKKDPLFAELVSHYGANRDAAVGDFSSRLRQLGMTAVEIMQEKLEDDESLTMRDLRGVAEFAADRSGFGKTMTVRTESVRSLNDIKASIEKEHRGRVIPRNHQPAIGDASNDAAELHSGAEISEGEPGEGTSL